LGTIERLERAPALFLVAASRIAYLMQLGRKGDGEPGAKAIWFGLGEVHVAAETLRALSARGKADTSV
jgi:hypothetical protein